MINKIIIGVFFVALMLSTSNVNAAVFINELSTYTTSDDWIELYADSDTDLSGWILKDETGEIKKIDSGVVIGSSGYYSVNAVNRLNKDGDRVILLDKDNNQINEFVYGNKGGPCEPQDSTQSVGRESDGSSTIVRFQVSTKDATNDGAPKEPCPTPSPTPQSTTPTHTPTPTKTPTPTNTPHPTATPKNSPTPTIKVSPTKVNTPTPTIEETKNSEETSQLILGESTTITPTQENPKSNPSTVAVGAKVFLIAGLLLLGIAIITFTQRMQALPRK